MSHFSHLLTSKLHATWWKKKVCLKEIIIIVFVQAWTNELLPQEELIGGFGCAWLSSYLDVS